MKIIRACYSPLLDLAQAISTSIYKKMLQANSFPAQKAIVTSDPSLTSRVVSIIKCITSDPATHSILMVDQPGFKIVDAHNEYLNGNMIPVVTWTGGKPPYRFWVSYRPAEGTPDDDVLGTRIVNLAPEFLHATIGPDIYTMQGIITKNIDYWEDGWWADDLNGEFPQDEIGIVIEDSSDTPQQLFAPFTPLVTSPDYEKYTGTGHSFGPDTWCPCPFEYTISSEITYGDNITFFSTPRGRIPGTETEVAGTYGVYTDPECTQAANLTMPNAGSYLLFVQFVPDDTTHLRANAKEQTVMVAKATQGPLTYNLISMYGIDDFYEIVGEIGFYQIFGSHPTSGNRVLMWVDPAQNEVFSFNGVAGNMTVTDVHGVIHSNVFGCVGTYTSTGLTTYYVYQEASPNYLASETLSFTVTIYPVGFRARHIMVGGGVGGGTISTVNLYPEKHVMVGGGVGGGNITTAQAKTHIMSGGGVGGGSIITSQAKQDQVIQSLLLFDAAIGTTPATHPWVTLGSLALRDTTQKLYVVATCDSDLRITFDFLGGAGFWHMNAVYKTVPEVWGGIEYNQPHTYCYFQYDSGETTITASQAGNAYWNAAPDQSITIIPSTKIVLTLVSITWYTNFRHGTSDHSGDYAYCGVLLSENILCSVAVSSSGLIINGAVTYISIDAYRAGTGIHFYSITPGSYTCTVSVTNNPLYADFSYTFAITVPGAPAKQLNSVSGFPSYFIANVSGSTYYNQIGSIRLASMGDRINSNIAVTGTNKIHYVQEPQAGSNATITVTFTLGATPFFGNSPKYTYSTVYMSRFDAGCTMRIQHPGNAQYFPFDATWDLTSTGAKIKIPPEVPPPETGPSWHITRYQCSNPDLSYYINGNYYWGTYRKLHSNGLIAVTYGIVIWYWVDVPPYTPVPYYGSFSPDSTGHGPAQVHAACVKYGISELQANIAFFYDYLAYASSSGHFSQAFLYSTIHVISIEEYY